MKTSFRHVPAVGLLVSFLAIGGGLWAQTPAFDLRIMDPRGESTSTTREVVHVLGRTLPDAKVTVGGESARVFGTGIFVRDNVPLLMGENRLVVVATAPDGQKLERVLTVKREAEAPAPPEPKERPLEIDEESIWGEQKLRLVRVAEDGAGLSFGLHEVRLGGPYLAELPAGTLLRVTGMRGNNYHVQLSPDMDGWIERRAVEWAPAGVPLPHLSFTDLSVYGNDSVDLVTIPYPVPVPFAVTPGLSPAGRATLDIDFYGAHNATTWISHRPTAKAIREATVRQVAADHLRVCVELKGKQLWGYQCAVTNRAVVLRVRRPPRLAPLPDSPVKGLTIALEPGHGGSNSGARGVSGSQEKDINRGAVEELARQFEAAGAKVVVVRPNDDSPSLGARVRSAVAANADLFISVHANAAGHQRGYLSVSGTSTYYKWPFCRDLSEAIHARLLDLTKLGDFGNVGNFNYYPIRANTWMPSMLVEQAFMSNPEDEAKMLDPAFRKDMMRAVVLGTEDWLKSVRADAAE